MTITGDRYTRDAPSVAGTLDLFAGEWSSRLPGALGELGPGTVPLFEDDRIRWMTDQIGGVAGMRVLELGPLEGGHSYMLERAGAEHVLAIESNSHAYLKCLIAKELLGLTRTRVLFGDFMPWLAGSTERFDLAVASGVLYHMVDPIGLLARLARASDRVFLWTHYYDGEVLGADPQLAPKFRSSQPAAFDDFAYTLHRQEYLAALELAGFCGGSERHSFWLSRDDILRFLEHEGLTDIRIEHESRDHPHGPCFSVLAQRPTRSAARAALPVPAPMMAAPEVEATLSHYRARIATLTAELTETHAALDEVTGSRLWRTRRRLGSWGRRVAAIPGRVRR